MSAAIRPRSRIGSRALVGLIRLYQRKLSPVFAALGSQCAYQPSCSEYMADAVREHGLARGAVAGIWRLLRCNPFSSGGYDPVRPR